MAQAYGENLKQALDTLRTHKTRSALTVFGVVLGVGVIMLVSALITGFNHKVEEQINQVGANTAFVSKWDQSRNGPPPLEERLRKPLTLEDAAAIAAACPAVKSATAWIEPRWTSKFSMSVATRPPKVLRRLRTESAGACSVTTNASTRAVHSAPCARKE